ncbi:translocation/assembly module TamB domain-containing protein [Legionella maioricensis]|uniref:Translocation/assembly module TamB domain-containing protein n=1 Tax=Legionella maioricensis TaxID=2896528 RepID=A0A9X2CXW6_9GAMM|nr:translocation/assembly module TamB domain-containing protein [Legionella maioricensis]MCL9682515.1 translocation/assembly module TamB domain-containing protein [Legionella maioricensis]MCL9686238.1 translocation/assembly module TamB domain-containing protein [Legionella maioricensis]
MRKLIRRTFYSILAFLILSVALLSFFLSTTPGLYTLIKLSGLYLPGTIKVHHLNGNLLKQFTIGGLDYEIDKTTIKINQLTFNWQPRYLLRRQILIDSFKADSLEIQQATSATLFKKIKLNGQLNEQRLIINSLHFDYATQSIGTQLQIETQSPYALSGKIKLNPHPKTKKSLTGILDIGGELNQLQWTGEFHGPANISLKGSLKELSQLNQIIKWRDLQWQNDSENTANSPEGRINLSGILPNLNIELTSKIYKTSKDNWQLTANIHGSAPWKWNFDANLSQTLNPSSKHEGLYTSLTAKGVIKESNQGNIILTINPGQYQMPEDSLIPSLKFQGGTLNATLSPQQLSGKGSLAIDENKKLNLIFKLPKFDLEKGLSDNQPISANLTLLLNSFDFLKNISPDISNPKGHLTASLKTTGTWGKKIIESTLTLNQASVALPGLGIHLNSIDFTAHAKKQHWEVEGSLISANKKLILKGQGPLTTSFMGALSLQGTDFQIMNTKEYQINISPQMSLNFTPSGLNISGSILVPFAQIKPQTFSNSIALSEDVVFKTKNEAPPTPFNTNLDLRVEMGNEVELTFKGLHATLAGTVNLKKLPQGPVNATGELNVKKGEYKAYGQDLAIEQGELIFTGGRLDNPGINLRASKKIDTTTASTSGTNQSFDFNNNNLQNANVRGNISVGVEVTGRLTDPKIILFSNPSILSQADILSMLVLGRPASQANKAGGQLLLAAISSMNLGSGTNGAQLLEQLKKNLGFDLNVQTTSNYNLATNQISDSTAVVVGKSISKRIYLSYNVGLSQSDPNVLTLKYLLNKFYSIQVSSSTKSSGIDILYTSSK